MFLRILFFIIHVWALCSRNFQNVKLWLDFVEIWSFHRHSDFTWTHILANSNSPIMSFLAILEVLNFDFGTFVQYFKYQIYWNSKSRVSKIIKMPIFEILNFPKLSGKLIPEFPNYTRVSTYKKLFLAWLHILKVSGA